MYRHALKMTACAATMSIIGIGQVASAQVVPPVPTEIEGPIESWDNTARILRVAGIDILVSGQTTIVSPTADRRTARDGLTLGFNGWFNGPFLPGRTERGFIGGTAIAIGTWDPTGGPTGDGIMVADSVFTEPAENVVLGVITSNLCSAANCDGDGDFIRGSNGPVMLPVDDRRMPAHEIRLDSGFALDLTGADLVGVPYGMEGYYGNKNVATPDMANEKALHYFVLDLVGPLDANLANKDIDEVAVERASCRVGDELEIRGSVHSPLNPDGTPSDTVGSEKGVIQASFVLPNGNPVTRFEANIIPDVAPGPSATSTFRLQTNLPDCPTSVEVSWVPSIGSTEPFATTTADVVVTP
ncbi:MAG: hypothetical protein ACI93G_001847 [Hyphomonas sp.]|jgi:hypothetical protein